MNDKSSAHSSLRVPRMFDVFWKWAGRVPLWIKLIGIAFTAMIFPAFAVVGWLLQNRALLETDHFSQLAVLVIVMGLVGLTAAHLLVGLLTHPIRDIARVARRVDEGDLYLRAPVWANDEIGELGRAFNAMIDSLARTQTELEASNQRLRAGNQDLQMLYELAATINQSFNIETILETGLARALNFAGAQAGLIALLGEKDSLEARAVSGLSPEVQDSLMADAARRLMDSSLETERPWFIDGYSAAPLADSLTSHDEPPDRRGIACYPIKSRNQLQGILIALGHTASPASDRTVSLLMAVCNQLGIAVENASLWEELKRKEAIRARLLAQTVTAQEQERERISRELHDETGQALTALLVQLKLFERMPDMNAVSALAQDLRELVVQTLDEVRRLARDLRPSTLNDLGLVPTLDWYIKAYRQNTTLDVEFIVDVPEGARLMRLTELILYRVVQEALTNVVRHASAAHVSVRLEQDDKAVRLSIRDDGAGFDVANTLNAQERSLGLLGMRERVELIGATLRLDSAPGKGTCLQVEVALNENVDEAVS